MTDNAYRYRIAELRKHNESVYLVIRWDTQAWADTSRRNYAGQVSEFLVDSQWLSLDDALARKSYLDNEVVE